ncbi:MAG: PaaI family thioesterase [Oxalobacteraceae bacterium]|nr:MAG: PaaI family thioesterase [Oxalobacteraceae bacterium]
MTATKEQLVAFMAAEFPQSRCEVETVGADRATVSRRIGPDDLRPGGTVSGPVLMAVADVALYVAIRGRIGIVPLAVMTSLTVNFLRKPSAEAGIIAECRQCQRASSAAPAYFINHPFGPTAQRLAAPAKPTVSTRVRSSLGLG